jgi:hypothetical protein
MATKTFQEWWDEVEVAEQGDGAAPVVAEEMSGDIAGDGSLLKEIVKSGEPGPMPKSGAKVRVLHFDSALALTITCTKSSNWHARFFVTFLSEHKHIRTFSHGADARCEEQHALHLCYLGRSHVQAHSLRVVASQCALRRLFDARLACHVTLSLDTCL